MKAWMSTAKTVGLITYMRTDGVSDGARGAIMQAATRSASHGANYVPDQPRFYDQGQERPGSARSDPPDRASCAAGPMICGSLDADQMKLYELIWKRGCRQPDGSGAS
jgi:DNA topoisomerase-1